MAKIGKNTAKYVLGALTEGPTGILRTAVDLQDSRKAHKRKKELKSTPRTTNINTSPGVTHVSYSTNHGSSKNTENGSVNDNDWNYG
tara:strand:+ start:709 stop:969 length:261 start_codon:yes stop_codon:yes gene_type:complete